MTTATAVILFGCLRCSNAAVSCKDDEIFCLATEQCINKDIECEEVIHTCQQDEAFCLQSGKCVKIEGACSGNNEDQHCRNDEIYCLQRGDCIPKGTLDCTDEKDTTMCRDGRIQCLQTGNCIEVEKLDCDNNTDGRTRTCPANQVFCLDTEQCVGKDNSCTPPEDDIRERSCPEHQVKCLHTGSCVEKDWSCFDESDLFSCADNEVFCLQTGHCVDKDNACYQDMIPDDVCTGEQIKCLQTGQCIDKDSNCNDKAHICAPDQLMCLKTGTCVTVANSCDGTHIDTFPINCPPGNIMCLQTGKCISPPQTCGDKNINIPFNDCPTGQVMCLQASECIPVSGICDVEDTDGSPTQQCPPGELMCLQTSECIPVSGICDVEDTDGSPTQQCPPDEVMCLQTSECIPVLGICDVEETDGSPTQQCPSGELMCLQTGKCISVARSCSGKDPDGPQSDMCPHGQVICLQSGKCISLKGICGDEDNGDSSTIQCPPGQVICLHTGECITAPGSCEDEDDFLAHQCPSGQVMCLQTGECIPMTRICDEQDTDGSQTYQCPPGHVLCFQTGECISGSRICDDNDTDISPTYQCPPGQIMCLQTRKCISATQTCDYENTDVHSCLPDKVMCLQNGECISATRTCDGEDTDVHSCLPGQVMCLQTGKCISVNRICNDDDTGVFSCLSGQVMCLQSGKCRKVTRLCDDRATNDTISSDNTTFTSSEVTTTDNYTVTLNITYDESTTTESSLIYENSTVYDTSTVHTSDLTTTQTIQENHILLLEPLLLQEDYQFVISEILTTYNLGPEVQISCDENVQVQSTSGTILTNAITFVNATDKIVVTVTSGIDAECRIISEDSPSNVYVLYIKVITIQKTPTVKFIPDKEEIAEDTSYIYFDSLEYWYNATLNEHRLDLSAFNLSDNEQLHFENKYKDKLLQKHYQTGIKVGLKLQQVPLNSFGVPVAILEKYNGIRWIPQVITYSMVDIVRDRYRVRFTETCNCQFTLELRQTGQVTNEDNITIQVIAINDSPELSNKAILRYSQTVENYMLYPYVNANTEFKIKDFIHHFYYDEDEHDDLGLAVIGQISETIGVWEFHRNNSWNAFPVVDTSDIIDGNKKNVTVYPFNPNDTLRFVPNNSTYLWTRRQAIAYTKLFVLAWDGHNPMMNDGTDDVIFGPCNGIHHKICGPGGRSEYSKEILTLYISREGCDNVASSLMSTDSCGVCGGHDDCIDCTGTANGGAVFDMCGDCTGGSSGLVYGQSLDCSNECGTSYYEQRLQMCIRNGTDIDGLLALLSCDSVLNSGAYINRCGLCVLGSTGLSDLHGEDICGICGGDGTSCVDCNNVVDGQFVIDLCGACLDPSDINFNKGCQRLGSVAPSHIRDFGQHTLHVLGVKLHVFTSVACTLEGDKTISFNETIFNTSESKLDLLTPVFSGNVSGEYNISCVFDGNTTLMLENSVVIYQYLTLTDISPEWMNIGQHTKVNITTSTIENTGFLQCVLICPFTKPDLGCFSPSSISWLVIPTTIIDSTTVQCDLQTFGYFRHSRSYNISVILEPKDTIAITRLNSLEFVIRAEAPVLQSVTFDRSFCYVHVLFNTEVTGPRMCQDIFPVDTLDLLGTDPFCIIVGKRLLIDLGEDYTLRPDDTIVLKPNSIYRFGAMSQYADFTSGSVNINSAHDAMQPQFALSGPSSVGSCEGFYLALIQTTTGCMKFRYKWTVDGTSSSKWTNKTEFTTLKNRIESTYNNLRMIKVLKNEIPAGQDAEFIVSIDDIANNSSHTVRHTVTRDINLNPVSVSLKLLGKRQSVDPTRIVRFYARAKVVECYNASEENIKFSWQSGSTDFSLSIFNDKPVAAIRPNTLRGGTVYSVTINAFLEDDSSAVTEETITFQTISKSLIVSIDGGDYMVFSAGQQIILDAGISRDPDRQNLQAFFSWTCRYENRFPCLTKHGNETVLMSTQFPTDERVVIPANTLSIGNRLIWTVTMNVGNRFGSFTTTVDIVNILPPNIDLPETTIKVNHNKKLRIPCTISSYGPVMMTWSNSFKVGYDTIDLTTFLSEESLIQETSEAVSNWDFSLYIDLSGDISLPAGANFVFTVSAFALDNGQSREQHVFITVNSPPTTGDATVTPTNGTALTTIFTIDIGNGWTDINGDSTVLYFYVKEVGQDRMKMNARGLSDVYSYDFKLTEGPPLSKPGQHMYKSGQYKNVFLIYCGIRPMLVPANTSEDNKYMKLPTSIVSTVFKIVLKGTYDVMVEICDTYEACSNVKIQSAVVVLDKVLTSVELDREAASITRILKADINQAVGMALALSSLLRSRNSYSMGIVSVLVNDVTENLLTSVVASVDPVDATSVLDSSNVMLRKLSTVGRMSTTVITESQSLAFELASFVTQGRSRRRRKRSTTVTVTPLSISDAEVILTTYSASFATQSENSTTSNSASQYLEALDNIFIGVCATVSYVEDPVVIYSDLTTINIDKRVVENTASNVYDVSCRNCSTYITHPAAVIYEQSIQSKYTHWNCSAYISCYGACFASAQITKDLVTPTSPSEMSLSNRVRRSDIVVLKVVNPFDYTVVTVGTISAPVLLSMSILGDVNTTAYGLQCLHWSGDTWNETTCVTGKPFISDSVYKVNCSCMTLGYFAIFEGPIAVNSDETTIQPEDTTVAMETSSVYMEPSTVYIETSTETVDRSSQTTETSTETTPTSTETIKNSTGTVEMSTVNMQTSTETMETSTQSTLIGTTVNVTLVNIPTSADSVEISFTIDADYSVVIGNNKESFITSIKQTIANTMGININRIANMNVQSGSIIVTFTIESGGTSQPTIESALQTLYDSILSDGLNITDTNGTPLSIIKASFSYEVTEKEEEGEKKSPTTLYIVFGCLGTLLAVAAVVIGILLHKMKLNQTGVTSSPPPLYGPQMHGVDVPIPANSGTRQFVVQEGPLSDNTPIGKQTASSGLKDGKGSFGAGNGYTKHDVDIVALEKGTGSHMRINEKGAMQGQGGCYIRSQSTNLKNNWMESETVRTPRIGSAQSIPGPADYMPPING